MQKSNLLLEGTYLIMTVNDNCFGLQIFNCSFIVLRQSFSGQRIAQIFNFYLILDQFEKRFVHIAPEYTVQV